MVYFVYEFGVGLLGLVCSGLCEFVYLECDELGYDFGGCD